MIGYRRGTVANISAQRKPVLGFVVTDETCVGKLLPPGSESLYNAAVCPQTHVFTMFLYPPYRGSHNADRHHYCESR
ncbi:hypothetical protein [Mycolicibacterium lutetiense]